MFVLTLTGEDCRGVDNDLSALWRSVIMTTDDHDDDSKQPQIGDLLRARGRLQVYRGTRQISCKHISKHFLQCWHIGIGRYEISADMAHIDKTGISVSVSITLIFKLWVYIVHTFTQIVLNVQV